MQLETDEHWYSLFGFFYAQTTEEQKCEIIMPHTRDTLLDEIVRIVRTDPNDVLKSNLLLFIEENIEFMFDDRARYAFNRIDPSLMRQLCPCPFFKIKNSLHVNLTRTIANIARLQRACGALSELLSLPAVGANSTSYRIKSEILTTLTSIMIEMDLINTQPKALESFINILLAIISHVNSSVDRTLRQTAAECLREINIMYSGILTRRLSQFFTLAQEEKTHAQQSYLMLFSNVFLSTTQMLTNMLEAVGASSKSELFMLPEGWLTAGSRYYQENPLPEQHVIVFEDMLSDIIGVPKALRGTNSSPSSTPHSSKGSTNLSLLDGNKPTEPFTIPAMPFPYRPTSALPASQTVSNPAIAGYRPLQYSITTSPHRRHPVVSILKKDIRRALTLMLESLPLLTTPEALRLVSHVVYIMCETTQSSAYGSALTQAATLSSSSAPSQDGETFDPFMGSSTNGPNSLIKPEFFYSQLKPFLRSWSPLLWHAAAIVAMSGVISIPNGVPNSVETNLSKQMWDTLLENCAWAGGGSGEVDKENSSPDGTTLHRSSRMLCIQWMPALATRQILITGRVGSVDLEAELARMLSPYRKSLFPVFYDDFQSTEMKVRALMDFYYVPLGADLSVQDSALAPPSNFLNVISLLNDFVLYDAAHPKVMTVFRLLRFLLRRFHPVLFEMIMLKIESALLKNPKLIVRLNDIMVVIRDSNDPRDANLFRALVQRITQHLERRSVSMTRHPLELTHYLPILSAIACMDFVIPNILLDCLQNFLETEPCPVHEPRLGDWQLGDDILKSIQSIMLAHKPRHMFGQLRVLLCYIAIEFGDIDIRDRAHFLYQLVTHLPDEKIRGILTFNPGTDAEEELAAPAAGPTVGQPQRKRGISQGMYDAGRSSMQTTYRNPYSVDDDDDGLFTPAAPPPSFLALKRLYPFYNFNSFVYLHTVLKAKADDAAGSTQQERADVDFLDDYLSFLNFSITDNDLTIELPYLAHYKSPEETQAIPNLPPSLFSVTLEFKPTGTRLVHGNNTQSVNIPILCKEPPPRSDSEAADAEPDGPPPSYGNFLVPQALQLMDIVNGEFPTSYAFVLNIGISVPLPTYFMTKATFNTEDGSVGEIDLESLPLNLRDMFLPVMWARCKQPLPTAYSVQEYASDLFEQMWTIISSEGEQNPPPQTRHISEKQRAEFACSVKYLERPAARVREMLRTQLEPFLLDEPSETASVVRVFLFLPRAFHLLLKFKIQPESTVVSIATDFWRVLAFADRLFDDLLPR